MPPCDLPPRAKDAQEFTFCRESPARSRTSRTEDGSYEPDGNPAYEDTPGNEAADMTAKEATCWKAGGRAATTANEPSRPIPLKITLRRMYRQQAGLVNIAE